MITFRQHISFIRDIFQAGFLFYLFSFVNFIGFLSSFFINLVLINDIV
jgi:hypothetical protein